MSIFIQSLMYIISIVGIFVMYFILTDKNLDNIIKSKDNKLNKQKIMDIYTYNIDDEEIKVFTDIIEKNEELNDVVDIVNIYQKFDK